jgi:hypothetical protein
LGDPQAFRIVDVERTVAFPDTVVLMEEQPGDALAVVGSIEHVICGDFQTGTPIRRVGVFVEVILEVLPVDVVGIGDLAYLDRVILAGA